jgi:predicted transcriptional regulator/FixJ family two-component response regulator
MDERDLVTQVRLFASSELRLNILLCLKNSERDINDLQRVLGGRNTTILHAVKDMIDSDLIIKDRYGYRLTNLGKIKTSVLDNVMRVFENLETNPDFWLNHDISSIPPDFLDRLGMLFQSEIISPDPATPLKCHEILVSMLAKSKKICAILPVLIFPKDSGIFSSSLRKGSRIDLLIADTVIETLFDEDGTLSPEFRQAFKFENFKLRLTSSDVKLVLVVTESFVYLGLWRNDGVYDVGSGTIYTGECAVTWGMQLFEYYFGASSDVGEADLMEVYLSVGRSALGDASSDGRRGSGPEEAETVLLVEDNVGHAAFIRRLFEGEYSRWNFHHAINLRDALRWIEENKGRSFLVIADYLLPDGCGLDLARDAENPREVGFPLIILTGFGSEKIAVQAFKSGAMDYVVKDAESMQKLPESARRALRKWGEYKREPPSKVKSQDLGEAESGPRRAPKI